MTDCLKETHDFVTTLTLNRIDKHNAFDDTMIHTLTHYLIEAIEDTNTRVVVLKAHGKCFSAGADLAWMQRMIDYDEEKNYQDSMALASLMNTLHTSPKPTMAMVQGPAYGGGVGLVAACDIAIASTKAIFCLSEVKLGLLPAVISPYVVAAIGRRQASRYFLTAEPFDASKALSMGLLHQVVEDDQLEEQTQDMANKIIANAPLAVAESKEMIAQVSAHPINQELISHTARVIAKKRVSCEGQLGLKAFLTKQKPNWN